MTKYLKTVFPLLQHPFNSGYTVIQCMPTFGTPDISQMSNFKPKLLQSPLVLFEENF